MGIDQRSSDRCSLQQTEIKRGRSGQAGSQRRTGCYDVFSDFRVAVQGEIAETNALEIAAAPTLFVREKIPLAGHRAGGTRGRPGCPKREIIGEIKKMPGGMVGRWQMTLQPQQLRNFHFRRNRTADIAKHVVMGVIDQAGFGGRAMVHPHDHVAARVARRGDRQRMAAAVEHHQRAGCVEADSFDSGRRKGGFRHRRAHRGDTRCPDVGRRLLDDTTCLMPGRDRMSCRCEQHSLLVEYTGARARCSNIDTDERLLHSSPIHDPRKPAQL